MLVSDQRREQVLLGSNAALAFCLSVTAITGYLPFRSWNR